MTHYISIIIGAVLVNNVVFVRILGLCPVLGVSKKLETTFGMGAATMFVMTFSSGACYVIDAWILVPLEIAYLRTFSFIIMIASVVQFMELAIRKNSPALHQALGIYLPLITTNCAVLGVPLLAIDQRYNFAESLVFGLGSSAGFALALMLLAGIRERIETADVPLPFRGSAIALVTAGLMSLAFMGFSGLDKLQ